MTLEQILLLVIAVTVAPKAVLTLSQFLPLPLKAKEMLEKISKNGNAGIEAKMDRLVQHYNEDTTSELKKMNVNLEAIKDENIKHHTFEEGKFELLEALIKK